VNGVSAEVKAVEQCAAAAAAAAAALDEKCVYGLTPLYVCGRG